MDRSKIEGHASTYWPSLPAPTISPAGEDILARLDAYWHAMGVQDAEQRAALSEQALRKKAASAQPNLDPMGHAILAAGEVIDDWLGHILELPKPSSEVMAARAALFSGAIPDWPAALFAPPGEMAPFVARLRAAMAEPTPAPIAQPMPAQRIALFSVLSLLRGLLGRLR